MTRYQPAFVGGTLIRASSACRKSRCWPIRSPKRHRTHPRPGSPAPAEADPPHRSSSSARNDPDHRFRMPSIEDATRPTAAPERSAQTGDAMQQRSKPRLTPSSRRNGGTQTVWYDGPIEFRSVPGCCPSCHFQSFGMGSWASFRKALPLAAPRA